MRNWSAERKLASLFLVCLLALAGLRFYSHYNTLKLIDSDRWAAHAAEMRLQVQSVLAAVEAARVAHRDVLIRRDGESSRAYADARRGVSERISGLGARATTQPARRQEVEALRDLVDAEVASLDESAAAATSPVIPDVTPADGPLVARIREAAARIDAEEARFLDGHVSAARGRARREFWVSTFSTALVVGLLGLGYWLLLRHFAARRGARLRIEALNEDLRRKVEELQSLVDVMPVGVVISQDPEGKVIRGNAVMAGLLGIPRDTNVSLSAPPQERPPYRVFMDGRELRPEDLPVQAAAARGQSFDNVELEVVTGERTLRLCGNVVPLRDGAGRARGAVGAFWDAAVFAAREERLIEERDAAEAAAAATEDLVATVSHDLRTPLHAVKLLTSTLWHDAPPDADETRQTADRILRLCDAQARLISDVLDLTRISHGRLTVDRRPVRLADVAGAACDTVRPVAEAAGVRLDLSAEDGGVIVKADAPRLQQVFWNLLSNAVKFTGRGGRVSLALRRFGGDVEARVCDTGEGIAPEELPHLFDRFWKGERPGRRNRSGLGLGLAIARHVVELHDGSIAAESEGKGRGAAFIVRLPTLDAGAEAPSTDSVSLGAETGAGTGQDFFRGTDVEQSPQREEAEPAPSPGG